MSVSCFSHGRCAGLLPTWALVLPSLASGWPSPTLAQSLPPSNPSVQEAPTFLLSHALPLLSTPTTTSTIEVVGDAPEEQLTVPGSAEVISQEKLEALQPLSAGEVLRTVSGVHVVEEEGIGLRLNLGFRGLDPDRSRTVLVLEDGVPVAPGVYGSPELYYTPLIEGATRLEVVKGSGGIQWGPQTVGGVVNLVTPEPPLEPTTEASLKGGSAGFLQARVSHGKTQGALGTWAQGFYQQFEGPRALNLARTDLRGKVRIERSSQDRLTLKLNLYDERSQATYLGLTTPQYETDPTLNAAIHDVFHVQRLGLSAHQVWMPSPVLLVQSTAYGHLLQRNWSRQDYVRVDSGETFERIVDGAGNEVSSAASEGASIFFLDQNGQRNRGYGTAGLDTRATLFFQRAGLKGELDAGARLHIERAHLALVQGETATSQSGTLLEEERRQVQALSTFVHTRLSWQDRLRVSPGLRLEGLVEERTMLRQRVDASGNPSSSGTPTDMAPPQGGTAPLLVLIPGLGVSFQQSPSLAFFGGVHRGFAPPRTQDAISATGQNLELEAELSWNSELGVRLNAQQGLRGEVTGFWMEFENQVIPPSESSGVVSDVDAVNAGATRHVGVETRLGLDPLEGHAGGLTLPLEASYTFVHARFTEGWSETITGNVLPYAPEQRVTLGAGIGLAGQGLLKLTWHYVGPQYADKENTLEPTVDGTRGLIEGYQLVDFSLSWKVWKQRLELQASAKNLLNVQYIASRRPAGIQPGSPRLVMAGLSASF